MNVEIYKQGVRTRLYNLVASSVEIEIEETVRKLSDLEGEANNIEEQIKKFEIKLEVCKEIRKTMKF